MVQYKKTALWLLIVFVLLCAVVFIFFADEVFCIFRYEPAKDVILWVNDTPIYTEDIDDAMNTQDFTYEYTRQYILTQDVSEAEQSSAMQQVAKKDREQVVANQIRIKVTQQKAKKLKLEATYEEAAKQVNDTYALIEQGIADNNIDEDSLKSHNLMVKILQEFGMTLDEYKKTVEIPNTQYVLTKAKVREWYIKQNNLSELSKEEQKQKFESYVDDLVKKAEIRYTKK